MQFEGIDHLVITTQDLEKCLHFYVDVLGMELARSNGRYAVRFGNQKFNIHTRKAEFLPAAEHPTYGSLDLCLVLGCSIQEAQCEIEARGYPIELGPVARHGARGEMRSLYLRDPDGNLVELCSYEKWNTCSPGVSVPPGGENMARQYLVIDIGGTFVKYALMGEDCTILRKGKVPTNTSGREELLGTMASLREAVSDQGQEYVGVAVSMPGRIDTAAGIAHAGGSFMWMQDEPIASELEEVFQAPVTVANDGKCSAYAEAWHGALAPTTKPSTTLRQTPSTRPMPCGRAAFRQRPSAAAMPEPRGFQRPTGSCSSMPTRPARPRP